jgi:hypothetical protein
MIRRISPFALPVAVAAFALGTLVDGTDAGWSAAIAIVVVYLNFVAHGSSLALAATISPTVIYAVGLGGFLVRLGLILLVIALLQQTEWFSIVAFIAALIPSTIAPARGRDEAALRSDAGGPVGGPERRRGAAP